tara:strand:- start:9256 stop:11202 length:1947 start_codon:yes stop_codon:yes gene_type:complete
MEENKDVQQLYFLFQGAIYLSIIIEIFSIISIDASFLIEVQHRLHKIFIYTNIVYSKLFTFCLILIVSIGTKSKKDIKLNPKTAILLPIILGIIIVILSIYFIDRNFNIMVTQFKLSFILYVLCSFLGMIFIHMAFDNISKIIKSSFMKDRFNIENESFPQSKKLINTSSSVNIPMLYYYKKRINKGWINIVNIYRGTLVIGTPGSGKTFGVIIPFIKQLINKGFTMLIYDYKYPDLTKLAYYYYLINKKKNPLLKFHVINLSKVEYSRRVNPLKPMYIKTLADASETAETLVQSLQKSDKQHGADQFFTQSAINFLSAVIYFFAKYENGKYSTFPHILNFISQDYEDIFNVLYTNDELEELLSIFKSAYENKSFSQLDGQIGTLRTNISRLASREIAWIFTGDDVELKISDRKNPSILIIANEEETQSINSASNALILNRIIKLVNTADNLPSAIVIDESPTIYLHKIDKLIATARSRKVAILLGLQELPQLIAGYGRETSDTITSVMGNIVSGAVRKKETLNWLQQIFGKVKQQREGLSIDRNKTSISLNEQMDYLIPESKISNLQQGEVVAQIVGEGEKYDGQYKIGSYNCKINLDVKRISEEEKKYPKPPKYYNFVSEQQKEAVLKKNYDKVKNDIKLLILDNN